jgi:hypothetical protein
MGLNREKQFPDKAQRDLQDAADALRDASEKLVYATRRVPMDVKRLMELDAEVRELRRKFAEKLLRVL